MPEHRAQPRRLRAFAPAILGSLVAVAIVVVAIVAINVLHRHHHHHTAQPTPVASTSESSPFPTPSLSPSTSSPTPTPTPTPTVRRTTPKPTAVLTPAPGAIPVDVFNNSRVRGRAALATSRLRAAGYVVPLSVSRGYAGANVVYYDPGNASMAAAARGVVARHLGITAALARPASIPATGGLIVVVTSTYQ